ncbi:cytochrome b (mitochondrion) [Schistosoma mansoni]|uniref:Cytochrome b n=3 Tax=Schistosoma mansoni TaxID=6183 RepID=Q9B8X3_SCHMA|nr:cytochrome b [Schistosoma mansoni]AAG13164.2 cytochrome b [Schistosoma mansoni]|eukprot:NP_066212.2 cytochrome b (mitochondrion) [Schistosoma mansoni]
MKKLIVGNLVDLPISIGLNYYWCVGFILGIFMVVQVISGVVLSLFYSSISSFSFLVWADDNLFSWFVRYLHIWGVSVMFFLLYVHIGRGLYYSSYNKVAVWSSGFLLYLLIMIEAFLGYILPWHQMSYWAATVLTSVILSIPLFGSLLYTYIVGGYSVTVTETLLRFFPMHVVLGIIILVLVLFHLYYLHSVGSSMPLYISDSYSDCVYFHKYYSIKDVFVIVGVFVMLLTCMFVVPHCVLDCESFIEANFLVTPENIKPEWYFLLYYAMLRSVNSKLGGLLIVLIFLFVLWLPSSNISCIYSVFRQVNFWLLLSFCVGLGYIGACHAEYPYNLIAQYYSFLVLFLLTIFKFSSFVPLHYFHIA